MAEKKLGDLPPVYSNLGYDIESEAGPSAPSAHGSASGDKDESEAVPIAPPAYGSSCDDTGYQQELACPTAPPATLNLGPPPLVYSPPSLVFEDVYDACVNYVKKHCCYGSRFINRMRLTEITNRGVYHYKLESFGEKRQSAIQVTPYKGGPFDGPENGPPPEAWSIPANPPVFFVNCDFKKEIPHTATVHICNKCDGVGKITCSSCWGRGRVSCGSCSGRGRNSEGKRCTSCSGSGKKRCYRCSGSGRVTCPRCDGYGKIKKCKILIVTWTNHPSNFVTDTNDMPGELIIETEGTTLFEQTDTALQPLLHAPEDVVNAASISLLGSHQSSFPYEMIIRQRHVLRAVPFTRVKYQWKEKEGEFYVYGPDRKVYFEVYPQRCCCCTCC